MNRRRELLLHPIAVIAIAALIANDHWFKDAYPGWLTGKLSDAAGLALFPLLLVVLAGDLAPRSWASIAVAILITALGFTLVKTCPAATALYRVGLGALQWPFLALGDWLHGSGLRGPVAVAAVTDPSDLLALPFTGLAAVVAWRTGYVRPGRAPA